MKIAVCEDNAADLKHICGYIKRYCENNCFLIDIHTFDRGETLLGALLHDRFDIIFLDIIMDGISGIDAARKIRETDPLCILVFITVSGDYALDAYAVDGIAYVLKPIDENNLTGALHKCRREFMKNSRFITVPIGRQGETRLPLAGIQYAEVYGKEIVFHQDSEKITTQRMTLDKVERELGGVPFLRCHRSYIVNMNYVDKLKNGFFQMKNGDSVPIRRNGYSEVQLAFSGFIAQSGFWSAST